MNETKPPDEREYIEALLLDALDGNLSRSGERELNRYLKSDPELAEELASMQSVEILFTDIEMVEPPVNFVQNTMDQIPNPAVSRWIVGFGFALTVLLALTPLAAIAYFFSNLPAQETILQLTETVLNALAQAVLSVSEFAAGQPMVYIVPIVMVGSILLWTTLYRRMVGAILPARG